MTQPLADRLRHVLQRLEIDLEEALAPTDAMSDEAMKRLGLVVTGAADAFLAGLDPEVSDTALEAAVNRLFRVNSLVAACSLALIVGDAPPATVLWHGPTTAH